ncbi:lipoprotein [Salmonella enterica]|uniref:Lipoprotein n=1 Tax=Salmonella sp. NCTC 6947 TaxID=2583581 RepID=A0A509BDY9_9ENTR|nr:lipoprotein [Salmonella enterica]
MKRTKSIHHASFRKSWSAQHLTPVALAVTAVFMLAGCEKSDETVSLYQTLMTVQRRIRAKARSVQPRITMR